MMLDFDKLIAKSMAPMARYRRTVEFRTKFGISARMSEYGSLFADQEISEIEILQNSENYFACFGHFSIMFLVSNKLFAQVEHFSFIIWFLPNRQIPRKFIL